jgi:hypothetical protein
MKKIITTTIKTLALFALMTTGVVFADAASFDPEPYGNDGFNTINTDCLDDCANDYNSVSFNNVMNNGNGEFTVYLNFRNQSSGTLQNARASVNFPSSGTSSSATINASLNGNNAGQINDSSQITGMPDSWEIDYLDGFVRVEEHYSEPNNVPCSDAFPGNWPWQINNINNPSNVTIGDLHDWGNGWCDQGYVFLKFRITDTSNQGGGDDVEVLTRLVGSFDENSATLRGRILEGDGVNDVWFALTTGSNPSCNNSSHEQTVSGNYTLNAGDNFELDVDGLNPGTKYTYLACAYDGSQNVAASNDESFVTDDIIVNDPDVNVRTETEENVTTNSARLNGRLLDGTNVNVWFSLATNPSPNCNGTNGSQIVNGPNSLTTPTYTYVPFDVMTTGLLSDTRYYYVACADDGNTNDQGTVEPFDTLSNGGGDNVNVTTENETNLESDSVTLNGRLTGGKNVKVWFTYSTNNRVTCNTGTLVNGSNSLDAVNDFSVNVNQFIQPDTTYYYVACGDDRKTDDQGRLEQFTTPEEGGNGGEDEPRAETQSARDIEEDSAELRGDVDMNDFNNGIVFFVYGQDEDMIKDVEDNYDEYRDARNDEDNDNFRVVRVDSDLDGEDRYEEKVNNLEEDEKYFFIICVEYKDNNNYETLDCGNVKRFDTDNDIEVRTDTPRNITQTTAEMCGTLEEDGGNSVQTWIEFRRDNQNSFDQTSSSQRRETSFCTRVSGLSPNTLYLYRACTPERCAPTRTFKTQGQNVPIGLSPIINTDNPTNIRANSATLNGTYVANSPGSRCWFQYGRTAGLGSQTVTYPVNGIGSCTHNFTGLSSNQNYCVRAVVENQFGTDQGSIRCFTTLRPLVTGGPTPKPQPPIIVVDPEEDDDLDLGLGLSLIRLEINNDEEVVTRGESLEYVVEWENISELDLNDLSLRVEIPEEIQITDISRGRLDQDTNTIFFSIDELDGADYERNIPGDNGRMTINGIVGRGTIGNLLTSEAEIAYDNPVNDAQENARDFDLDEYGAQIAGVTASVFGLTNITFLGWLVILLGLFIIFLVARWLYLEREELRAQAYIGGGYQPNYLGQPQGAESRYDNYARPVDPYAGTAAPQGYREPAGHTAPVDPQQQPQEAYYEPYQPNRG